MRVNSTAAKSQCAGGVTLKQVRYTTSRDNAVTDVGHQQSGDLRHQRRHRLADGHSISSSSNNRDTISTMIIRICSVASRRKERCGIGDAVRQQGVHRCYVASFASLG